MTSANFDDKIDLEIDAFLNTMKSETAVWGSLARLRLGARRSESWVVRGPREQEQEQQ